jgi:hypothetical protein
MGEGGWVEKGDAKNAFVLEEEESEMDVMSENVEEDEVLEPDDLDRESGAGFSVDAVMKSCST